MVQVQRITADDWALWRTIRLRALSEAPEAFGSRLAGVDDREVAWRSRIDAAEACFLATVDEPVAGTVVGMVAVDTADDGLKLQSMFVAPQAQGQGGGRALVTAVVRQAAGRPLRLTVVDDNMVARTAYQHCGFRHDGGSPDDEGCVTMHYYVPPPEEPTDAR